MSKTTVTSSNAMTAAELDAFLSQKHVGRLGSIRKDGSPHVTPIWYVWEEEKIWIILGTSRLHVRNLERDPRASLCIDEDPRLEHGFAAGAIGAFCSGTVELRRDPAAAQRIYPKFIEVYGFADDADYIAGRDSEERVIAVLTPASWTSWDFTKS